MKDHLKEKFISLIVHGKSNQVVENLGRKASSVDEQVILGVALAAAGKIERAETITKQLPIELDNKNDSLRHTALGLIASWTEDFVESESHLQKAIELDPTNAISPLSLAKYYLWVVNKPLKARNVLESSKPNSSSVVKFTLNFMAVESQLEEYRNSYKIGLNRLREKHRTLPLLLGTILSGVLSTPLHGSPILFMLSLGIMTPYIGLIVFSLALLLTIPSAIVLRKDIPSLSAFSIRLILLFTLIFIVRLLIYKQIFP